MVYEAVSSITTTDRYGNKSLQRGLTPFDITPSDPLFLFFSFLHFFTTMKTFSFLIFLLEMNDLLNYYFACFSNAVNTVSYFLQCTVSLKTMIVRFT